ncbi:MAG: hypothetical protein WBD34_17055 [Burkholderiaceae bacterium]
MKLTISLSPLSSTIRIAGIVLMLSTLSACYESEVRMLNYGDRANLEGKYICTAVDGSRPAESVEISVQKSGQGNAVDYVYRFSGGGEFRFSNLSSGMFIGQTHRGYKGWGRKEHDSRYGFVFLDVKNTADISFFETNFGSQKEEIGRMMEANDIRFKENPYSLTTTMTLSGSADNLFDFFNGHGRSMLKETVTCTSQT